MLLVFGADRRDSSAIFGLAGLVPLLAAVVTSPAYFIGQIVAFCSFRLRATPGATVLYSTLFGIAVGAITASLYWQANGGGPIPQAR